MPEAASFPQFRPLPWLMLGAVIGVAMFGMHGIGAIVLTLVGVGFAAKWMYRWQAGQGHPPFFAQAGGPQAWASCGPWGRRGARRWAAAQSGNSAFDDYRAETLRRLENDQQEFQAFLERLRRAKDKAEFDQFMAERDRPSGAPPVVDQPRGPWQNG